MARISEFEQSSSDTFEVAITAAEYADLLNGFQLRITAFDINGNEAVDTVNGGTLTFLLPTDQSQWTLDPETGEYVYVQPITNGTFTDNNHNVTYQGFVLSSDNPVGYDTVYDAYMVGAFNAPYDGSFSTVVRNSTYIAPGTAFTAIDQSSPVPGTGDATVKWDAPDIDTPIVTFGAGLGDTGTAPPPCFVAGTLIACENGECPVESLKVGDRVVTLSHGLQTIRWIGQRYFSGTDIVADARLRPVRIGAGALGTGVPKQDLLVSRQHRVVLDSEVAKQMTGLPQVLIAAHQMARLKRISTVCPARGVTYYHLLFDRHEVVFANGAATESFYLCKSAESAKCLSSDDLMDIEELGLLSDKLPPALPVPVTKVQREIVGRLVSEGLQFVEPLHA